MWKNIMTDICIQNCYTDFNSYENGQTESWNAYEHLFFCINSPREPFRPERALGREIYLFTNFIICAAYLGRYAHFIANVSKSGISIEVSKNG